MQDSNTIKGKTVSDLQNGITISNNVISGTLKYVTGFTEYSDQTDEQKGNYLALDFDAIPWGESVTVQLTGDTKGPIELTEESKSCVFRISDKDAQTIKFVIDDLTEIYTLTGLTLEQEV